MSMFPSLYAADIKFKVKLFSSSGTIISSQEDSFAKADHLMLENIKRAREAVLVPIEGSSASNNQAAGRTRRGREIRKTAGI